MDRTVPVVVWLVPIIVAARSKAARALVLGVRIPLEAWMDSRFFCVALSCVGRDLATGRTRPNSPTNCLEGFEKFLKKRSL
jgi:hypothetical protein